jgi:hypothetical protein
MIYFNKLRFVKDVKNVSSYVLDTIIPYMDPLQLQDTNLTD